MMTSIYHFLLIPQFIVAFWKESAGLPQCAKILIVIYDFKQHDWSKYSVELPRKSSHSVWSLSLSRQVTSDAVSFTNGFKRKILTADTSVLVLPTPWQVILVLPDLLKLWFSWFRTMWRKTGVLPPKTGVVTWPPGRLSQEKNF